jgi:dolichyl-phosphate beta-glucosyltransferase
MAACDPERRRDGPITSLIFPTFNPGPVLERTYREMSDFLRTAPGIWEVLFVCDGCTDGSPARLMELAASQPGPIQVLSYTPNRGKGYAVRRGLAAARGDWRLFTDVDLAYSFDDLLRVTDALRAGAPVAVASRTHPDTRISLPARLQGYVYKRHLQSLIFSKLVRLLLPVTQMDTQAGLKGLSAAAASLLLPHLSCDGFGLDCELLTACARSGLTVVEVPVCLSYHDRASTTSLRSVARMVKELWHIRRTWGGKSIEQPLASEGPGRRQAA